MSKGVSCLVFSMVLTTGLAAQSGRRTTTDPSPAQTPSPAATPAAPSVPYSESIPRPPRTRSTAVIQNEKLATPITVGDEDTVKVETSLVTIPVSVFDRNGLYIRGLKQEDFTIFENGKEQQIAYFGTEDKPFTVVLLLDTSPSTHYRIEEIHKAAESFVNQLNSRDSMVVIEFNSSVKVQCERTQDRDKIFRGIERAKFGGGTSLYNAVDEALRKQLSKIDGRKAVVLFTDGVDTTSRKNSYDSTVNYAEESDSLVFPIYYDTYSDNQSLDPDVFAIGTRREDYALGRRYLQDLADVTGGRAFRAESTPGGLERAFEGIAEELRRQYNIGYVPDTEGKPGERRTIKVRVDRPNLIIRSRDSYIVGAAKTPPTAKPSK
jgi:Ca-activated chloride channel family protein